MKPIPVPELRLANRLRDEGKDAGAVASARAVLCKDSCHQQAVLRALALLQEVGGRRAVRESALSDSWLSVAPVSARSAVARRLAECGDLARAKSIHPEGVADYSTKASPEVDWDSDLVVVPSTSARTTIVVFTGLMQESGIPLEQMQSIVERLGCNFVALRDRSRLAFLKGHRLLGDSPTEAGQSLRKLINGLGSDKVVFLSSSAGSLGAFAFAVTFPPNGIVTFGAISSLRAPHESRGRAAGKRIMSMVSEGYSEPLQKLAQTSSRIQIESYFAADLAVDRIHAEVISKVVGSNLAPLAGLNTHNVVEALALSGRLPAILKSFVDRC